jgi:hypothetical protein
MACVSAAYPVMYAEETAMYDALRRKICRNIHTETEIIFLSCGQPKFTRASGKAPPEISILGLSLDLVLFVRDLIVRRVSKSMPFPAPLRVTLTKVPRFPKLVGYEIGILERDFWP